MIPYGRHDITETDIDSVLGVLRSKWLTQGPMVPAFEAAVADYCGVPYAVAVNSATSALHLACIAVGVGPGDRVWTSPITFVASANCALYCGAHVDFVDIDSRTRNLSVASLTDKLERARTKSALPKALVVVHFAGEPCDMKAIHELSVRFGFRVIEDASHAIGAKYRGEPVGACSYSDVTVFSFHPVKMVTTGEGGVAVCRDPDVAFRLDLLRSHGITRDPKIWGANEEGPWYYEQIELGFNYRMTDIQAALGLSQLKRLDSNLANRQRLAMHYDAMLAELPLELPFRHSENLSALHLYVVRLLAERVQVTRRQVFDALREKGVGVSVHYIPVPAQPYFRQLGFSPVDYPNALAYYQQAITLPLFATLSDADQIKVVDALHEVLSVGS